MAYRAVLFDMDGTVLDTLEDLAAAVNACFRHFGVPEVSRDLVRAKLGNGAVYLIHACVPEGMDEERIRELIAWYKPYYDAHCRIETRPYPGIPELMAELKAKGVKQAIISNKPDPAVQELAAEFFPGLLETAVGESERVRRKPDPDAVLAAVERMGLQKEDCVYIGDTEVDLATARNAGMDVIAVSWGFRSEEHLRAAGAVRIANSVGELGKMLSE